MSPYYADPARPAGRRWWPAGKCVACWDSLTPTADQAGATHALADKLCIDHLLESAGVPKVAPTASRTPPDPSAVRAAFRARLRGHSEANAAPTPITLARQAPPTPLEPEALAAAMLVMAELGAVPLRTEPTYGMPCGWGCPWKPSTTEREFDPGRATAWDDEVTTGAPGLEVGIDDEAVPSGARKLARSALKTAWTVRVKAGPTTVVLTAERLGILVMAVYRGGRYSSGWLRGSAGDPVPLSTKQAEAILKGA